MQTSSITLQQNPLLCPIMLNPIVHLGGTIATTFCELSSFMNERPIYEEEVPTYGSIVQEFNHVVLDFNVPF